MYYTNARSLLNKMAELETVVDIENLDTLVVSETWLTSVVFNSKIQLIAFLSSTADRPNCGGDMVIL